MVKNSRTPARPDQLRPLNTPRQIRVITKNDLPVALFGDGQQRQDIVDIQEIWCIDDEWWRDHIQRRYYRVQLRNGAMRTIYVDAIGGTWNEQKY
jgi:hypothetical protein